jgi:hypothetical protein
MPETKEHKSVTIIQETAIPAKIARRPSYTDMFESFSWLLSTCVLFTWYNAIGELASRRGLDYAWVFDAWTYNFDRSVPLVPSFVFVYIAVYAMPAAFLACTVYKYGYDMGIVRRFFVTQMAMIVMAFCFYYAFPTKTDLITDPLTGEIDIDISSTWIHRLNYRFIHQGISMWVASPSMHTAHSWAIAMDFTMLELPGKRVAQALALLTLFSTILCKPHGPPHLLQGAILAYLVHVYLSRKMFAGKYLEGTYNFRLLLAVAVPVAFHLIGQYLAKISGWHIDIPVMLGFDHRIPGGFKLGLYGF